MRRWAGLQLARVLQHIKPLRPCFLCPHTRLQHNDFGCKKCNCMVNKRGIDNVYADGFKIL